MWKILFKDVKIQSNNYDIIKKKHIYLRWYPRRDDIMKNKDWTMKGLLSENVEVSTMFD